MNYPFIVKVNSSKETEVLALEFASSLKGGEVIILNGNLGAGKTYFVKKAGAFFNINSVNSPTFAIINEYEGSKKINHFDFYRINSSYELLNIGLNDYYGDEETITFIEWGNLFPEVLPEKRIEINIKLMEDYSREFTFTQYD